MSRLSILIFAAAIIGISVAMPQTVGQEKSTGKTSDEVKDALKRIAELEKKLVEQNRELRILQAETRERAAIEDDKVRRDRAVELERRNILIKEIQPLTPHQKTQSTLKTLQQPIETKGLQEKLKLATAVDYLGDQTGYKVPFVLDRDAFVAELGTDAPEPFEEEVSLVLPGSPPKMPMEAVLRQLLAQVGKGHATYVIRSNHIEITTLKASLAAHAIHQVPITMAFDQRPVKQVLQDLTDESGIDIHLDPNVGKMGDALIAATFRNATLDNALVTVTEMANLKYVVLQRNVFVTTAERAKVLRQEEQDRAKHRASIEIIIKGKRLEARP
ncbi:MAG TPA: hypothetical protein VFE62_24755 [Gemmataceae bacterium]|nr:hypothetical protein [Gemmataceae bacterium]